MRIGRIAPDVSNLSAEFGLKKYRRRFSDEQKSELDRRLKNGESQSVIAKEFGVPPLWVHNRAYQLRLQRKLELPYNQPDPIYDRAQQMWLDGASMKEIAMAYQYNFVRMRGVIERYRKMYGWFPYRNKR